MLIHLHGTFSNMLQSSGRAASQHGEFYIRSLYGLNPDEFIVDRDTAYWGGDGIRIQTDIHSSGLDVSNILRESGWVAYQPSLQKHYIDGHEVKPCAHQQKLQRLWSV